MKTTPQKRKKEPTDSFAFFKKLTSDAFSFLVADYDLKHVSTQVYASECVIRYRNETTGVLVFYENSSIPWIVLMRLKRTPDEVIEAEGYGLNILAMELGLTELVNFDSAPQECTDDEVEEMLRNYARMLREHGRDILTGDFRVFPKLKQLAKQKEREINKQLFGSETGETL